MLIVFLDDKFVELVCVFFFSSRRRHTRCALVTGVQTCALPIFDHAFRLYPQIPLARNTCPASGQRLMRRRTMTGKTVVREGKAEIDTTIRAVLRDVLGLSAERAASFRDETPLFGALPEQIGRASCRARVGQYV